MNKRPNKKRRILTIALAAVVLLIILAKVFKGDKNVVTVQVSDVTRSTITESVPANGKIQPITEVKISPDVSGEIVELNCEEGDAVKAGDLLIKIKQDVYISAVDRAEASLNSTKAQYLQQKAQLAKIEATHNRNITLFEQKTISRADYETSLAEYMVAVEQLNSANYNVKSAEAALKEAKEELVKTTIYAPMTGIVSKLSVEKGERVVGTSQMAGTEMLRIANLDKMEVLVDVNENDIIRLSPRDTAYIEVDAYPGRKFKGIVTQIANSAKSSETSTADQVTNFEVRVSILQDSYSDLLEENAIPFRPGMSASVTIVTDVQENAIVIPLQAITTREELKDSLTLDGTGEFVFIYNASTQSVEPVAIRTGIQDLINIEVKEGLTDSMKLVTGPYNLINSTLKRGTAVKVSE